MMDKQTSLNETLQQIKHNNVIILDMMDSAVNAYTIYSEQQREFLQNFQYAASIIALLFMLYSARLTMKIEENFTDFLKHSEAMAISLGNGTSSTPFNEEHPALNNDELTIASMHMSHFVDKMNTVIQHAQQAINESENAAKELAIVSEQIDDNLAGLELDDEAKKEIDTSEDIVIQTLEELSNTSALLNKLQKNLNSVVAKTKSKA
jgi:methyl-accepting chemotaxis protein